jgi:cellulose synthase operon protein C
MSIFPSRGGALRVAALVSCALVSVGCGGAQSRLASHMQRGEAYLADGNDAKASVEFRNAMLIAPRDLQARLMAGRAAEGLGRIREALGLYQSVLDIDADNITARAGVARVMVLGNAPERAFAILDPGLEKHPNDPQLLTYRAAARMQVKNVAGAREDLDRVLQLAPADLEAISLRASMYRNAGQLSQAVDLVSKVLAHPPAGAEPRQLLDLRKVLVELYLAGGDLPNAENQLRALIALKPANLGYRLQLVDAFTKAGKLEDARRELEAAVQALPEDNQAKLTLASFVATHQGGAAGEQVLKGFIAHDRDNYELRLGLGELQEHNGATDAAAATYRDVVHDARTEPPGLTARDRLAVMAAASGRDREARDLIAQVLQKDPRDAVALVLRSQLAMKAGDATTAIGDLRAVLRDMPEDAGIHRLLGQAYLANGEPGLAAESFRSALDRDPRNNSLLLELTHLLVKSGHADQAVKLLEPAVHDAPQDFGLREELTRAYLVKGDYAAASTAAENLKTLRPDNPTGYYLAGVAAAREGHSDEAARELQHALDVEPHAVDALATLVQLELAGGQTNRAIAAAKAVADRDPSYSFPLNVLGELYTAQKKLPEAIAALTRATELDPGWWAPYGNLAVAKLLAGDTSGAISTYQAGIKAAPAEPHLVVALADLYQNHGRVDEAIAAYESWHAQNPKEARVASYLALLLVNNRKDQASLDRARELSAAFDTSSDGYLLDTDGWVHFKRAEYQQAVPVLERAVARMPDANQIHYHLGMAELQVGNAERARSELETALSGAARFSGADDARVALASLKQKAG